MNMLLRKTGPPYVMPIKIKNDIDSVFNDFFKVEPPEPFDRLLNRLHRGFFGDELLPKGDTYPKVDIVDYADKTEYHATVVGLTKDDIEVQVKTDPNGHKTLILKSDNKFEDRKEGGSYRYREIKRSRFLRSFPLSENLDVENTKSSVQNGLLIISIPKIEKEKEKKETYKKIEIT